MEKDYRNTRYYQYEKTNREVREEIIQAIAKDPHQIPLNIVKQNRQPKSSYENLDITLPFIEMVRNGDIYRDPIEGWKSNLPQLPDAISPEPCMPELPSEPFSDSS